MHEWGRLQRLFNLNVFQICNSFFVNVYFGSVGTDTRNHIVNITIHFTKTCGKYSSPSSFVRSRSSQVIDWYQQILPNEMVFRKYLLYLNE